MGLGFPGANSGWDEASYVVVGAPLDVSGTGAPGARFGPDRVRRYARGLDDYDRGSGVCFTECGVHDTGDVRWWDNAAEYVDHVTGVLGDVVGMGTVPLVVGGEHTVTVAGVRATTPDVYVCLDAHLDLYESFDGNPWSHATVTHHVLEEVEEVVIVGARTGSRAEWERVDRGEVTVVPPARVGAWEPSFDPESRVYVSVDVDAADPGVAPGTGTMEPGGLSAVEMLGVVRQLAPFGVGFDVVEVNDRDHGQAAVLAAKLLRVFVSAHAQENTHAT